MKNLKTISDYLTEKRVVVKRKYTERYPAKLASTSAKVRNVIFDAMSDGVLTEEELIKILSEINANKRWLGRNSSLFNISEDQDGIKKYTLSKFGQRIRNNTYSITEGLNVPHKERGKKPVNIFVGRFQPFTLGHVKVFEQMYKKNGYPVVVFLVRSGKPDPEKKPFDEDLQQAMFAAMAKQYPFLEAAFVVPNGGIDTLFAAARPAYEPMMWGYGTDRKKAYDFMINKPEYRTDLDVDPGFTGFEIKRTDDDVSASKVRKALIIDDESTFKKMTPKSIHSFYKTLQNIIQPIKENYNMKNLKTINEFLNESVNEKPVNEGLGTIALGIMLAWAGLKVITYVATRVIGKVAANTKISPKTLKLLVNEMVKNVASQTGKSNILLLATSLKIDLDKRIDSGEIKTIKGVKKAMEDYLRKNVVKESIIGEPIAEKAEMGLYVYPSTQADFKKLEKWLDSSDYYGEVNDRMGFVFFPEEKRNYDELEMELDKEFIKAKISARFEGQ